MRLHELFESFLDLETYPKTKLIKGFPLVGKDQFEETDPRTFWRAITRIRASDQNHLNKGLNTLTIYSIGEYKQMRCWLGKNNSSGFALQGNNLVSVFSSQQSSGESLMQAAISNGAKELDCFALRIGGKITGPLYRLYSRYGFKINVGMNVGVPGEPYSVVNGISDYVDEDDHVCPEDERVVVYMIR